MEILNKKVTEIEFYKIQFERTFDVTLKEPFGATLKIFPFNMLLHERIINKYVTYKGEYDEHSWNKSGFWLEDYGFFPFVVDDSRSARDAWDLYKAFSQEGIEIRFRFKSDIERFEKKAEKALIKFFKREQLEFSRILADSEKMVNS